MDDPDSHICHLCMAIWSTGETRGCPKCFELDAEQGNIWHLEIFLGIYDNSQCVNLEDVPEPLKDLSYRRRIFAMHYDLNYDARLKALDTLLSERDSGGN